MGLNPLRPIISNGMNGQIMTKDEQKRIRKIAEFGCILCHHQGNTGTPCEIHHIRRAGKRATAPTIGLCPVHHRFHAGIHHLGRKAWELHHSVTEESLLALTEQCLAG